MLVWVVPSMVKSNVPANGNLHWKSNALNSKTFTAFASELETATPAIHEASFDKRFVSHSPRLVIVPGAGGD